jgi:hypothetical protein
VGAFLPLALKAHDGRPLPHSFYEGDGAGLLVVLPGLHYGPDGPVLYLLSKHLQGAGWDLLGLTYAFQAAMSFPWTDHVGETISECGAALGEALRHRDYPRVGIVGKSLGTIVLAQLCLQGVVPDTTCVAYLTPPMGNPAFDPAFVETRQPAYVAIGTRDSFYDAAAVKTLADQRPSYMRILPEADHGLDVSGDLAATLRVVGQVVEDTGAFFLTGRVPGLEPAENRGPE